MKQNNSPPPLPQGPPPTIWRHRNGAECVIKDRILAVDTIFDMPAPKGRGTIKLCKIMQKKKTDPFHSFNRPTEWEYPFTRHSVAGTMKPEG